MIELVKDFVAGIRCIITVIIPVIIFVISLICAFMALRHILEGKIYSRALWMVDVGYVSGPLLIIFVIWLIGNASRK